jgi:hypothetical protein
MFISCSRPEHALPVNLFAISDCIHVANLGPPGDTAVTLASSLKSVIVTCSFDPMTNERR